ncbi:MAG TPA: serine/threonine-protein kinase, partial [Vicinamibacteria bacterium]|nr:serine/threonine-protein kinase [Vicinamibacteria bacterium]
MAWRHIWGGLSSAASTSGDEGRAFLQKRIAFFGKVGMSLSLGAYVFTHASLALTPGYSWRVWIRPDALLYIVNVVLLGVVWLVARGPQLVARALALLDAGVSFLACASAAAPLLLADATVAHRYRMLLVVTTALIARAAVLPTPSRWTLGVSAAAVLPPVVLTWWFHARSAGAAAALPRSLDALMWCTLAVAISAVVSHIIYGLRQEVREARQLGQYTLEEKLGEGGMGQVFRARHAMLRRPTAVKLLPPGRAGESALKRFEREVQLTAILTHPNTVQVFDYGRTADGIFYYAMEYMDGLNLDQLVSVHGAQPAGRVVHVLRQVAGALAEAHGIGLIHRDVKPANIILCERGGVPDVAKIFDFGLVREAGNGPQQQSLTGTNVITGTPLFLSPEAIRSPESVDARSDVYAMGGVAYFLLAGRHVFEGQSVVEICGHHLHTAPTPPSQKLGAPLPAELEALVLSCLEKDASRRPQTARELKDRLDALAPALLWTEEQAREWWASHDPGKDAPGSAAPQSIS